MCIQDWLNLLRCSDHQDHWPQVSIHSPPPGCLCSSFVGLLWWWPRVEALVGASLCMCGLGVSLAFLRHLPVGWINGFSALARSISFPAGGIGHARSQLFSRQAIHFSLSNCSQCGTVLFLPICSYIHMGTSIFFVNYLGKPRHYSPLLFLHTFNASYILL